MEKSVFVHLNNYLTVNGLHERFQSAHKAHHSIETALLTITNDILLSLDWRDNVFLLLLDLFNQLRNLSKIRKYLTQESSEIAVHAFITSKLDYRNSLLYGCRKM